MNLAAIHSATTSVAHSREVVVRRACEAIRSKPSARWTSARPAAAAATTPLRLQRAFRDVLGLSPRDYVVACKRRRFLDTVRAGQRVTDAIYEAGFGSPSRVYEALRLPGMTPATYGRGGKGAHIRWNAARAPIGRVMIAATDRGLCFVQVGRENSQLLAALREEFPFAEIDTRPSSTLKPWLDEALAVSNAQPVRANIPVDVHGTAFQWRVWRALTKIPCGETRTYQAVARSIGRPTASRAVARACATNPLALVVPCHRVVPGKGGTGGYRWGTDVKATLLARESAVQKSE